MQRASGCACEISLALRRVMTGESPYELVLYSSRVTRSVAVHKLGLPPRGQNHVRTVTTYGQFCPVPLGAEIFAERWMPTASFRGPSTIYSPPLRKREFRGCTPEFTFNRGISPAARSDGVLPRR